MILDVGTSSVRAALMDEKLHLLRLETVRRKASAQFDAEVEWELLRGLMKKAASGAGEISGVAVSALLGWVGVDAQGTAVTPCLSYMHTCPEEYRSGVWDPARTYAICRRTASPESGCFQLMHVKKKDPLTYEKIHKILSLKDFINLKLTGAAAIDTTTAAYTLLLDVEQSCWSEEMLALTGLTREKLPALAAPGAALAPLCAELCREIGMQVEGVPVAVGSVDGSTGLLGAGGVEEGDVVSVMGTTDVVFAVQMHPCGDRSRSLLVNPHVLPGRWNIGGPMGMYGGALDWFTHTLLGGERTLSQLGELADQVAPGSEGVVFLPTLAGERTPFWRPAVEGTVLGLRPCHRAEHLFRAMMEANCYANRRIVELARESGAKAQRMIAIGGGAKSDVWLQMKADVLGLEVCRPEVEEASLAGAAMLAMLAAGKKAAELPRPRIRSSFVPRTEQKECYTQPYAHFLHIHEAVAALYDDPK